ncbi:MAG: helix-turn-helix transcriptional regulator [Bdellovibrionales bacterium]|nr:helix-turn-helix transcriptional regulator [Bdellovibrionales bacterium]
MLPAGNIVGASLKESKNKQTGSDSLKIISPEQLAGELRKARKSQKITIEKLAQFADLSRYAVLKFENQKTDIKLSTLLKLLKLCNIELHIKVKR